MMGPGNRTRPVAQGIGVKSLRQVFWPASDVKLPLERSRDGGAAQDIRMAVATG
jgi:hypothetical protein